MINMYEYGTENLDTILLIHGDMMTWEWMLPVVELLQDDFHVIVPALPGYDFRRPGDFTGIAKICRQIERWMVEADLQDINLIYGMSAGGSVAARLVADGVIHADRVILDGALMPRRQGWLGRYLSAKKPCWKIRMARASRFLLERMYPADRYDEDDVDEMQLFLHEISNRTYFRTYLSCDTYKMPEKVRTPMGCQIQYWYGQQEEHKRKRDIRYVKETFTHVRFRQIPGMGHGQYAIVRPEEFAADLWKICEPTRRPEELYQEEYYEEFYRRAQ